MRLFTWLSLSCQVTWLLFTCQDSHGDRGPELLYVLLHLQTDFLCFLLIDNLNLAFHDLCSATECFKAKVWLDFLPAHTSQVLQPLDLGSFSVLKRSYRNELRSSYASSLTMTPKKPEFLEA